MRNIPAHSSACLEHEKRKMWVNCWVEMIASRAKIHSVMQQMNNLTLAPVGSGIF